MALHITLYFILPILIYSLSVLGLFYYSATEMKHVTQDAISRQVETDSEGYLHLDAQSDKYLVDNYLKD